MNLNHSYCFNQKVLILKNIRQPWVEGKIGEIARLMEEPLPQDKFSEEPYYYVFVRHSSGSSSGCVLPESALQPVAKKNRKRKASNDNGF